MKKFHSDYADAAGGLSQFDDLTDWTVLPGFANGTLMPFGPAQDGNDSFPLAALAAVSASGAGSLSAGSAKPVGTVPQLANYLVNGFWQYNGEIAHHWASSTITYNISGLTAAEQLLAQSALEA
jgi:serralysin